MAATETGDLHEKLTQPEKVFAVYTDGACQSNGKAEAKAGVGVFVGVDDPRNISLPLEKTPHTNNRAELQQPCGCQHS